MHNNNTKNHSLTRKPSYPNLNQNEGSNKSLSTKFAVSPPIAMTPGNYDKLGLSVRLATLIVLVVLLTLHVRSVKVFRWETTVSGSLMVTYIIGLMGLTIFTGVNTCTACVFQIYLCSFGSLLFLLNASVLVWRWSKEDNLRVLAELLSTVGMQLSIQLWVKVIMSVLISIGLFSNVLLNLNFFKRYSDDQFSYTDTFL